VQNKDIYSLNLLGQIYNGLPFAMRVLDTNYVIIDINQEFVDILSGITNQTLNRDKVVGKICYEVIGNTQPCEGCMLGNVFSVNSIKERIKPVTMLGGRTFKVYTQSIIGVDGTIIGAVELSVEMTDQINFEDLFNLLTDSVYIIDADNYQVLAVNDAATRRIGYNREELLKLYLKDIDYSHKSFSYQDYEQPKIFETFHVDKGGNHIPVEVHAHAISYLGKRALLGVARDISERKKNEEIDKELARLDRLNLVGEIAASIGHEVRNPMTTVRGFLQLFKSKKEFQIYSKQFDIMIEELDRANGIIGDFLSLTQNRVAELKESDLNDIVHSLYPLIQANVMVHGHEVNFDLGMIPAFPLDQKDIRQLILNIIQNAIEAMGAAGTITIKTYVQDGMPMLSIHDCGKGIPGHVLEKLGTPFFTTKEKGTGLGLAVCYRIAQRHNGAITIESDHSGTTFYVTFSKLNVQHSNQRIIV
jgi:two-component system, sporulation sensor kinase E